MHDINEFITKNFNDNISYLQSYHPETFDKLAALDSAIANAHYREKYELVYENNYFDVFEKDTNSYLYTQNSAKYADIAAQSVNYNIEENLFKCFHEHEFNEDSLKMYKAMNPLEHEMSGFAPIMDYYKKKSIKNKLLKTLNKFVFFGVGLGLHISSIHQKIHSEVYLIIEDDLELFRLSLFTLNYADIAKESTLIFSVFEQNSEFALTCTKFFNTKFYYNHYIKYFHILSHSNDKVEQFHIAVSSQSHLLFYYNTLLNQYIKPLDYMFKDYNFLNKNLNFNDTKLKDTKFLILGAGPSLQKNKKWLQENQENFIIVAVSATIPFLIQENIKADIIVHLDAFNASIKFYEDAKYLKHLENSIFFFSDRVPSQIIEKLPKDKIFFFENGTKYKEKTLKPSAPCVGSISYQILLFLNAQNIYLLGVDLAIDSKTGKTHIDSHSYVQTMNIDENRIKKDLFTYAETLFPVQGNIGDEVLTTAQLLTSIDSINQSTQIFKNSEQNVFNLGNGAKFVDIKAVSIQELKYVSKYNKEAASSYIYDLCSKEPLNALNASELDSLRNKLTHSINLYSTLAKYSSHDKTSSSKYIKDLINLTHTLTNEKEKSKYELSRVIDAYLKYILGFIFDLANAKEENNLISHLKHMDALLIQNLTLITKVYTYKIENKIKGN
ncbi:protein containing DUF115 [Sulfurimonas gotlandica GD1]|uniref:Protein containing DUF115 n=1 Tax=Sulfurimonas gotlandica (strain DSM 19862 / JCM 16533 / GD1) TaxID=929558 RepID=B6BGE4_SULGG|nr:6-hydroxymethylpterin diphosphokinase MptE-like protein [Sulfurimonas gotlandica]EDZ63000.1 conserved hypothetical protein [Sulfurimonas gotlandica GD1]EHP29571.1 protein containing DUF115 [Sulfurimonas gotlandica GD1]